MQSSVTFHVPVIMHSLNQFMKATLYLFIFFILIVNSILKEWPKKERGIQKEGSSSVNFRGSMPFNQASEQLLI